MPVPIGGVGNFVFYALFVTFVHSFGYLFGVLTVAVPPSVFLCRLGQILVLILSVLDADEVMTRLVEEEGLEDSCGMENTLVMAFLVPKTNEEVGNTQKPLRQEMPYKSLFNALNDLCQTRCS